MEKLEIPYVHIRETDEVLNKKLMRIQGVRAYMQQSRIFVGMVLILIFGEVLGLYGYAQRCTKVLYDAVNLRLTLA